MNKVLITEASYKDCRRAIELALSTFPLPVRDKRVLVKVNCMAGTQPEEGSITHPSVLGALVTLLEEMKPAEIMVGDNPGQGYYGRNQDVFDASGLREAAKGHYCNLGKEARAVPFDPSLINVMSPSRAVLDADIVISVPKFKTHIRTGVSVALKNSFGILPGAQKANLHHRAGSPYNFARALVEVFRLRPPDLFIVDGILVGQGVGPYSRELHYLGVIMASDNAVAMDATVARMMGYEPAQVPLIHFAQAAGLGSCREEDIEVIGNSRRIPGFSIPALASITSTEHHQMNAWMVEAPLYRPVVNTSKCDGCSICADGCTLGALTMAGGLPRLDPSLCVPCFCCQEVCPRQAIILSKPT